MAPKIRAEPFIYIFSVLLLFGWILMLSANAALQENCSSGDHNALSLGGAAGYLGPIECSKFYGYTWWITWYVFLLTILVPSLTAAASLTQFRAGLIAMLAIAVMLVGDTCNTFNYWNHLGFSGTARSRARVMIAGTIVVSIALYVLILIVGFADEKSEKVQTSGEPSGETYGGRFGGKTAGGETYGGQTPGGVNVIAI